MNNHKVVFAWLVFCLSLASPGFAALPHLAGQPYPPTLAPMLEKILPGVVNISIKTRVRAQENPLFNDPFFRRFFNVPNVPRERELQSAGSGVVVDAKHGYVLTNNHVVHNADEIKVTLRDGRDYIAKVIGTDPEADLAVVQVNAKNLTAVPIADSDSLRIGDFVVAIGNPFGLGQTVTSGIVSALGRSGLGIEGYEDFIQTDASINPGNSGGALVNLNGELIGINTAILGPNRGNVGIGFAIPSHMAKEIMSQLVRYGEVRRGQLGIIIQDLTPELADAFGAKLRKGVVVSQVVEGLSADTAGVHSGDVVVAVNGKPIANAAQLRNAIGLQEIGEVVELDIVRNGQRKPIKVKIARAKHDKLSGEKLSRRLQGAVFGSIESGHPLAGRIQGVEALEVKPRSMAWHAGIREADIIVSVNRNPVTSLAEMQSAFDGNRGRILLNIRRGNNGLFLVIR